MRALRPIVQSLSLRCGVRALPDGARGWQGRAPGSRLRAPDDRDDLERAPQGSARHRTSPERRTQERRCC